MIKKLYIYLQSGGLKEVINYILIYLRKRIYYKSETIFFYLKNKSEKPVSKNIKGIKFKIYNNCSDFEEVGFRRINTLNYKKWFEKNSLLIIGYKDLEPISFTWSHFQEYEIHDLCILELSDNKCWIGPTFVKKKERGIGLNQAQIIFQINNSDDNIEYFITSANSSNKASIRSFKKLGFKVGLIMTKKYGLLSNKKQNLNFYNEGNQIISMI